MKIVQHAQRIKGKTAVLHGQTPPSAADGGQGQNVYKKTFANPLQKCYDTAIHMANERSPGKRRPFFCGKVGVEHGFTGKDRAGLRIYSAENLRRPPPHCAGRSPTISASNRLQRCIAIVRAVRTGVYRKGQRAKPLHPADLQLRRSAVPVLGKVAAGYPITAIENIEEYVMFGAQYDPAELFGLRVQGESMKNVGIMDGDIVIVLPARPRGKRYDCGRPDRRRGDGQALFQGKGPFCFAARK